MDRGRTMQVPDDTFTEPDHVDPYTLARLGPLRRLAGIWEGRRGVDVNPKADGPETRDYYERIEMQPIDAQANGPQLRSEEHTSELQSLMRISYAVFCLKQTNRNHKHNLVLT